MDLSVDQLKQLLLNLTVNACEAFDGGGGTVRFAISEREDDTVQLVIRDDRPGIERKHVEKIFLPFFSTKKSGTGLGLAIVSRLMEALGGKIDVRSRPGEGTEFRLRFRGIHTKDGAEQAPPPASISIPS